ncbi:methyltransferase type 11 [Candidatus Pacearchaeota archaeon]|nr:methyltransferase type 11 [Candidatus Pacearchaeota archaeon]|tara:strand:- start:1150 stop:1833 length:684 start_codon:yes stop_codon:yes gene_type:complete
MEYLDLLEAPKKEKRIVTPDYRNEENRRIAREYGRDFFDGDRVNGYGGYKYDGRWKKVAKKIKEEYGINPGDAVLEIGCAKGFLLHDLQEEIPGVRVAGIDVSEYAANNTMDGIENLEIARKKVLPHIIIGNAKTLPWPDNTFDLVININTLHNLNEEDASICIKEMIRVSRDPKKMFIQVDAYTNEEEKTRMENWVLTAETMKSDREWIDFLNKNGYKGNYFWTIV